MSSVKAYEKMGAKVVGVLEKELCYDGIFYDVYLMIRIFEIESSYFFLIDFMD
jgi:hypothetical protein